MAEPTSDLEELDSFADDMEDLPDVPDEGDDGVGDPVDLPDDADGETEQDLGDAHDDEEDTQEGSEDESDESEEGEGLSDGAASATPSEMSDALLERAVMAGLSIEKARSFGDKLEDVLDLMIQKSGDGQSEDSTGDDTTEDDDAFDLDPEVYDEEVINAFGKLKEANRVQRERVGLLEEQIQFMTQQQFVDRLDREFESLGEDWQDVFGKGGSFTVTGEAQQARQTLIDEMQTLQDGRKARGLELFDERTLFKKALLSAFGEKAQSIQSAGLSKKLKSRNKQMLNRTGRRQSTNSGKSPEARATSAIAEMMGDLLGDDVDEEIKLLDS